MVVVTGGAGFIGAHTVRLLVRQGATVRVLDDLSAGDVSRLDGLGVELIEGSITDPDAVARAMVGARYVIHLAALVSVPASMADPVAFHDTNVGGFLTVLEGARAAGVERVVYASSCAVYGSLPGLPKGEGAALAPESPYAATKLANEAYASAWTAMGLSCVGLRYFNVFGPGQDPSGPYGAVIPTFVERAARGEALRVDGDGSQGRDFVSVRDVAAANVLACSAPDVGGLVFNVGTGSMLTIKHLADRIAAAFDGAVRVEHGPAREGDVHLSCADVAQAKARLGFVASMDFDDALDETIDALRGRQI